MLKLIGSVMIFGSCAALGLNARRELRRRVTAADAMLLALRLMENEITAHRTPMPEIIDLLAKNENAVVRQIFSGVRRRMRERSGLSLSYLWCAGMRAAQADAGLGREECGVLCDAANFLGRYDASEQKAAIDTALLIQAAMLIAGIGTLLQLYPTWKIGSGLPVVMGISFTFVTACLATASQDYGIMVGAIIVGIINNVQTLMGVDSNIQKIVKGVIIVGAVIIDVVTKNSAKKAR